MEPLSTEEKAVKIVIENIIEENTFSNSQKKYTLIFLYNTLDKKIPIPYDFIAKFVYESESVDSEEENERLNANITLLLKHYSGKSQSVLKSNLEKIRNNYKLSIIQKEFIERTITKVQKASEELLSTLGTLESLAETIDEKVNNLENDAENVKKEVESVKETKSSIYTDFISILGVFSAFVFLMFGGLDVVRAVIDVADDLQVISLSRLITLGSLMLVAVLTLLYCLLLWIARITGKKFGECHKPDCQNGCKYKWKHLYYRHSFYFSMIIVLIIIVGIMCNVKFDFK